MKALTISEPFASLIASGEKFVENRTWGTNYRGPLAIHAGKGSQYLDRDELRKYPTGCVIAIGTLLACMRLDILRELGKHQQIQAFGVTVGDVLDHKHTEGPWCWILRDVRRIVPAPARGAQGLWEWDGEPDQLAR